MDFGRLTFIAGLAILAVSAALLVVDQKTGWLTAKKSGVATQAQIRQQRLEAISQAVKNHQYSYHFEVSGANFLTMPTTPQEARQ